MIRRMKDKKKKEDRIEGDNIVNMPKGEEEGSHMIREL